MLIPVSPAYKKSRDVVDHVDELVQARQLRYSLIQLRLVGLLLLLFVFARSVVPLVLSFNGTDIQRLTTFTSLSTGLPLLPLGISLYLLGGGSQRLRAEHSFIALLLRSLLPLALVCLLLLPVLTAHDTRELKLEWRQAFAMQNELQAKNTQLLAEAERLTSAEQVRSLAARHDLTLPGMTTEPVELSRWRFSQILERSHNDLLKQRPILTLSPYQLDQLTLPRFSSTLLLQLIAGVGLLLLRRQGIREIHRYGLNEAMFFRIDHARQRHNVSSRN